MFKKKDTVTFDTNGRLHSYNDKQVWQAYWPHHKTWYRHGDQHRGGDKPAMIVKIGFLTYIKHHRIVGVDHRVTGPQNYTNWNTRHEYKLYDIAFSKTYFTEIINHSKKHQIPLWLSLLVKGEFIDNETAKSFANLYHDDMPTEWIFKALGLTHDETLLQLKGISLPIGGRNGPDLGSQEGKYYLNQMTKLIDYERNLTGK